LSTFHLVLLIHSHQPAGNFSKVLEEAYQKSYLPFVEALEKHPGIRLGLHYSGPLLEWFAEQRPEFFDRLRGLVERRQVELVGGGFYEPILISIPHEDRIEQIKRLADFLEARLGHRPRGAWLAERVWEPQLPSSLAPAGVEYTLLDDSHFHSAGFDPAQLFGYYLAEDLGHAVKLIPGLKALRYLVPFRSVEENIEFLRKSSQEHPGGMAAMGDDCEKFGVWPHTWEHCYRDGWIERYFTALEASSAWLALTPPGEYLATHRPLGRADLPTASYIEMMEWALPTPARLRFSAVQQEFSPRADVSAFLRGGFWRSFLTKYAESGLLQKKMLHVAGKLQQVQASARRGLPFRKALAEARTHLLRAQCNDAYWHGVFGGLYSPHLRTELWRELIRAERIADTALAGRDTYEDAARFDFDADGHEEICVTNETCAALLKPSDGGTLAALDFRPSEVTLINSIERRVEASHARLKEAGAAAHQKADSIHDRVTVKEENLAERLRYDRWPRHAFRLLLFAPWKTREDYEKLRLEESAPLAAGLYAPVSVSPEKVELLFEDALAPPALDGTPSPKVRVEKDYVFTRANGAFEVACDLRISHQVPMALHLTAGLEVVLNFLAPDEPDRFFEVSGARQRLRWSGAAPAPRLRVVDEWQNVAATLDAPGAREFWIAPIETVSLSEDGFERIYQGSQILAWWPLELAAGTMWSARLVLRISAAR
jgi:alpha-amylase